MTAWEGGAAAARAPDEFVRELFDGFADSFDKSLAALDYRVPDGSRNALPAIQRSRVATSTCSTPAAEPACADRSSAPSRSAWSVWTCPPRCCKKRRCVMSTTNSSRRNWRTFCNARRSNSTSSSAPIPLVYFGALDTVLAAAASALRPGGRLIFSLEGLPNPAPLEFRLNHSGRYAHHPAYAVDSVAAAGWQLVACTEEVLRKESGQPVAGMLIEARKPVP